MLSVHLSPRNARICPQTALSAPRGPFPAPPGPFWLFAPHRRVFVALNEALCPQTWLQTQTLVGTARNPASPAAAFSPQNDVFHPKTPPGSPNLGISAMNWGASLRDSSKMGNLPLKMRDFCLKTGQFGSGCQNGPWGPERRRFWGSKMGGFGGRGPNSPPQNGCWSFVLPDDAFSAEKGPFYPTKAIFGPTAPQQSPQCAFLAMNSLLWGFFPCAEMAPLSPKMEDCSPGAAALFLKSPFLPPNEARFPQNAHFWRAVAPNEPFLTPNFPFAAINGGFGCQDGGAALRWRLPSCSSALQGSPKPNPFVPKMPFFAPNPAL